MTCPRCGAPRDRIGYVLASWHRFGAKWASVFVVGRASFYRCLECRHEWGLERSK
jgi:hypothetical protein